MVTTSGSLASVARRPPERSCGLAHPQRADRRVRRLRLIGVVGAGDGEIGFEACSRDAVLDCSIGFGGVGLVLLGGACPAGEDGNLGRSTACRPAVPSASGRSDGAGAGVGRLDSRWVNARR